MLARFRLPALFGAMPGKKAAATVRVSPRIQALALAAAQSNPRALASAEVPTLVPTTKAKSKLKPKAKAKPAGKPKPKPKPKPKAKTKAKAGPKAAAGAGASASASDGKTMCWDSAAADPLYTYYHDNVWGQPRVFFDDGRDNQLFGHLCLELMQCGLNFGIILKKEKSMKEAFDGFDIDTVAAYTPADVERLLKNEGIIRHRGKIQACIDNARIAQRIIEVHGSFRKWVWRLGPVGDRERLVAPGLAPASHMRTHQKSGMGNFDADGVHPTETVAKATAVLKALGMKFMGETTCLSWFQAIGLVNHHKLSCYAFEPCEEGYREMSAKEELAATDAERAAALTCPEKKPTKVKAANPKPKTKKKKGVKRDKAAAAEKPAPAAKRRRK